MEWLDWSIQKVLTAFQDSYFVTSERDARAQVPFLSSFAVITRVHRALRHETPEKKWILREAISRPFAIAIRAARLYTAWLRYRSYVVVGLKTSIPTIQECLFSSARSFSRSKQDEVALLRSQGSFRTLLTSLCSTRPYL